MPISINFDLPGPSSSQHRQLPPQLVQFGSEGLLLIELQGALEVEGDKNGQLVGKLCVDPATVSTQAVEYECRRRRVTLGIVRRTSRRS